MDDNSTHEDIKVNLYIDNGNSKAGMVVIEETCDLIDSKMSTTEIIGQLNESNGMQQCPVGADLRSDVNIKIEPCSDYMEPVSNSNAAYDNDTSETLGTRNVSIGLQNECITKKIIVDLQAVKAEPLEVLAHSISQTEPMLDRDVPDINSNDNPNLAACENNFGNIDEERNNATIKEEISSNCHLKHIISDYIVSKDTAWEFVSAPDAGTGQKCIHIDSNTSELTAQQLEVESVELPSSNIHLQDSAVEHPYMVTDGCDKVEVLQTNGKEVAVTSRDETVNTSETFKSNGVVKDMPSVADSTDLEDVIIIDQPESSNLMDYRSSDTVIVIHDSSDSSVDDSDDEEKDCEKPSEPTDTSINKIISNEREDVLEQERNIKLNRYGFEDIRTKGELLPEELPPLEELTITVDESVYMEEVGSVKSIVGILVVIQSGATVPPLDDDTILFVEGHKVLGQNTKKAILSKVKGHLAITFDDSLNQQILEKQLDIHVFEVFGPVKTPWYSVRFNQEGNIAAKGIHVGMKVYCALRENSFTKFVFMDCLKSIVGSDASWEDNNEPPEKHLDYSDDEAERMAKAKKKHKRSREHGTVPDGEDVSKKSRQNQKVNKAQQSPRPDCQRQHQHEQFQQQQQQSGASKCSNPFQRTSYNSSNTNMAGAGHHHGNGTTGTSRYSREDSRGQNGQDFYTPASRFGGPPNFQNRPCFGSGFQQNTKPKHLQTNPGQAFSNQNLSSQSQPNQNWLFGNVSHTSILWEQTQPAPLVSSQYPQGPYCHKGLPDFTKPPPNFQNHTPNLQSPPPNLQSPPPNLQSPPPNLQSSPPNLQNHAMFNENRAPVAQRNANTPGCNQSLNTAHFQDLGCNVTFPTSAHHQGSVGNVQFRTRNLSAERTAGVNGNGRYQVSTLSRKRIPIHYLNTRSSADQPDKRTPGQFEEISVNGSSQSLYQPAGVQNIHSVNNSSSNVNGRDVMCMPPTVVRFENTTQWASKKHNVFNPSRYIHNNRDTY